ncbi:MAG: hypothetical protein JNK50_13635 [Bacteroidia bacterium]|nr:hypothetical protein [Bacteroidia bacterium]
MILAFGLVTVSCKKYEENPWYKPGIKKGLNSKYFITSYTVNDVDCLTYVNSKLNTQLQNIVWTIEPADDFGENTSFKSEFFWGLCKTSKKETEFSICGELISMTGSNITPYNIFITSCSDWRITKKYIKNKKRIFKISRQFESKTYEIQFN